MKRSATLFFLLLAASVSTDSAEAQTLDELRQAGVIAERFDGMAAIRSESADATARSLVESVNAKRREIYEGRAKKQGVAVEEVGKVYALEISQKAPSGTWFLGEDGKWKQKE